MPRHSRAARLSNSAESVRRRLQPSGVARPTSSPDCDGCIPAEPRRRSRSPASRRRRQTAPLPPVASVPADQEYLRATVPVSTGKPTPGGRVSQWNHCQPAGRLFPAQEAHLCAGVLTRCLRRLLRRSSATLLGARTTTVTVTRIGSVRRRSYASLRLNVPRRHLTKGQPATPRAAGDLPAARSAREWLAPHLQWHP
jgi:hypothetical protein